MTNTRSKLQAVFFPNRQQVDSIVKAIKKYVLEDDESLIASYNGRARTGLFGNQAQWVDTVALGCALKQRFGDPVIHYEEGLLFCPCTVELTEAGELIKTEFTDWH